MSKKFTGITSAGSAIPVYDKDAHSALQNKADVSALTAYQEKSEMTAYQPVGEYYSASNPSGFLTAVPAEYATSGDLEDLSTAIAETFQPQSAMTAYLTAVPEGYATVEDVESATSGLQEKGDYYSASNPSGFITGVDLTPYQEKSGMTAFQTIEGMSAYQPVGEYYSASNPSGFITGVDLTPYQTIEGMSAYQEKGDYYSASNPSGFISTVPDTYLQNTDLTIVDNKVTEISGIPLSAGDELPSGVMNTSALEYNAVNEISGYNGSAIAQYGAEKQWLQHDDTIVSISNSAQYAFGCNISALQRLMGIDETVLYNNTAATTADVAIGSTFNLNEPITNFNKFKIYFSRFPVTSTGGQNGGPCSQIREYDSTACSAYFVINETFPVSTAQNPDWYDISMLIETISGTTWKCKACYQSKVPSGALDRGWTYLKPYKVIGIGRISG